MLIDLHAHNITKGMMDVDDRWGPRFLREPGKPPRLSVGDWVLNLTSPEGWKRAAAGEEIPPLWEGKHALDNRLSAMDRAGVDKMVLSLPSHLYMYWAEPEFGVRYSRIVNEELAAYAAQSDRLYFWANLPMQDPAAAARELERAVVELGARGPGLGGRNLGGREFDDPDFDPVWAKCVELQVPLFVHGYNQSVTWGDQANDERYSITSIVGMCHDETACFWNLVCGGVFDRFPELKVYITHGGGYVPYQLGRLAATSEGVADGKNKRHILDYLENFYFDPYVHSEPMRRAIVEVIGPDNLVYGDNFEGSDLVKFKLTDGLGLRPEDLEKIHSANAVKLLRL